MSDIAIHARGLGKSYKLYNRPGDRVRELLSPTRRTYHREMWALRDVDFDIEPGTVTGLVGVNGAVKSTLLKLVAGGLSPTCGSVSVKGRVSSILELGTGFQPHLTGRQNAFVNALFLGLRPWEIETKLEEVLAFSGVGDYADQPLSTYSSGMQARLAFSVLTLLDPEVLILDEALATGDAGFAEKCKRFMRALCRSGCTTLIAGHDLGYIAEACDRVIWIDHGRVREDGPPARVVGAYRELLRLQPGDTAPRPRNALLRIEAEAPALGHSFILHTFEWVGPSGEPLGSHQVCDEEWFRVCLFAATETGLPHDSALAGWGPLQDLGARGKYRSCRPDLGPGGAAYLALPVPVAPQPMPARLRIYAYRDGAPSPAIISIQANGRFRELVRLGPSANPRTTLEADVAFAFGGDGAVAPPFDGARIGGPPVWASA